VPVAVPDHPAPWAFSIHVLFDVADLLPFGPVIQAMHNARGITQKRPHDSRDHNDLHDPALHDLPE
jgi:hypothetical protein